MTRTRPAPPGSDTARDIPVEHRLIARRRRFVFCRQVDPQLDHLQRAAVLRKILGVKLFVKNAGSGSHPLHVPRTDDPTAAGGVKMLDLALVDDGHRLEAAVRMLADATRLRYRRELGRSGVVQHQEGADVLVRGIGERTRCEPENRRLPNVAGRCCKYRELSS